MNAINAVQLFIVVWIFTTLSQADEKGCSVSCDDVTGSVGKEVTFTCRVSQKCTNCCIKMYKFLYPESYKDSTICRQELPDDSCDQRNIFTCSYTPTTAMTQPFRFRFFIQTTCDTKTTEICVNITESTKPKILTDVTTPEKTEKTEEHVWEVSETREEMKTEDRGFKIAVITAVVSSLIIIIVPIIYRIIQKRPKRKRTFVVFRNGDDCSHSENVII